MATVVCEKCAIQHANDPDMAGFVYWFAECSICTHRTFVTDITLLGGLKDENQHQNRTGD